MISIKEILRRDNHIQIYLPADDPEAEQFLHGYVGSLRCSVYQARGDRKICLAAYRTHHSGRGDRLVHNILLRKKISQDLLVGPFPTDLATGVEDGMVDYSLLILFTGFSFAAFQFWKLTVNNVITVTINKAIKNTHQ